MSESPNPPAKPVSLQMRELLFGDSAVWPPVNLKPEIATMEPWASFVRARRLLETGEKDAATSALRQITEMPNLESRQYLQAWHFLRGLGAAPPPDLAKQVLGVVVEAGMPKGLDVLVGYADHQARYWNFSGAGVVWERPNDMLDSFIDNLIRKGAAVAQRIGPWEGARPKAPSSGIARLNMLTPSGLHFGEGPIGDLSKDGLGGPVFSSAFQLMQKLIEISKKASQAPESSKGAPGTS
jgi:hypothetical protein